MKDSTKWYLSRGLLYGLLGLNFYLARGRIDLSDQPVRTPEVGITKTLRVLGLPYQENFLIQDQSNHRFLEIIDDGRDNIVDEVCIKSYNFPEEIQTRDDWTSQTLQSWNKTLATIKQRTAKYGRSELSE